MHRQGRALRFGAFELDVKSGELRKAGRRVHLAGQPVRILEILASRSGEVIGRDELRRELWPADTTVDFEHNLNSAVKRLRAALGDSAEAPRFIETLPRRGYRFLLPVELLEVTPPPAASGLSTPPEIVAAVFPAAASRFRISSAVVVPMLIVMALGVALVARYWPARQPAPPQTGAVRSIAVLPFVNLSNDADQDYLTDGITEALTMELSRIGALQVTSRTSAARYKNADKAIPTIASELGVDAVVEGTVQREAGRVRVTVQLISGASDVHLWANRYERKLDSVLSLQREIAAAIAGEIRVSLASTPSDRGTDEAPVPPQVSELYLRGRHLLNRKTRADVAKAREYFDEALVLAPDYALAHVGLALTWVDESSWPAYVQPREGFPRAKAAAERALALDPTLAEAYATKAFVAEVFERDMEGAERWYRKALELSPSNSEVTQRYALHLRRRGRIEEGLVQAKRAHDLDPVSLTAGVALGVELIGAGRVDESIAQLLRTSELDPSYFDCYVHLSEAYQLKGHSDQALEAARKAVALSSGSAHAVQALIGAYIQAARTDDARLALRELEERPTQRDAYDIGKLHLRLGDDNDAISWFRRACDERAPQIAFLHVTMLGKEFDRIRTNPRFKETLRCVGDPATSSTQ